MNLAALIRSMSAAGAPPEAVAIAVEAIEAERAANLQRKAKEAKRKAEWRLSRDIDGTRTGQGQDCPGTTPSPSPEKDISPTPPIEKLTSSPAPFSEASLRSSDGQEAIDAKTRAKRVRAESDQNLLDGISDIWNVWAASHGSPQVQHLTGNRAIHCRRRINELMAHGYQTAEEAFRFLLSKCDESFFVKGNPRKKLEFKQLLSEEFVARMVEGSFKYNSQGYSNGQTKSFGRETGFRF